MAQTAVIFKKKQQYAAFLRILLRLHLGASIPVIKFFNSYDRITTFRNLNILAPYIYIYINLVNFPISK